MHVPSFPCRHQCWRACLLLSSLVCMPYWVFSLIIVLRWVVSRAKLVIHWSCIYHAICSNLSSLVLLSTSCCGPIMAHDRVIEQPICLFSARLSSHVLFFLFPLSPCFWISPSLLRGLVSQATGYRAPLAYDETSKSSGRQDGVGHWHHDSFCFLSVSSGGQHFRS